MLVSNVLETLQLVKRTPELGETAIYWINEIEQNTVYPTLFSIDPQRFFRDQTFVVTAGGGQTMKSGFDNIRALGTGVFLLDITAGNITSFSDAGGGQITVTSTSHGLVNGDEIRITGTINYDGTYTISNVATSTFEITETFVATETGVWSKGTHNILREYSKTGKDSLSTGFWINKGEEKIYFTPSGFSANPTLRSVPENPEITATTDTLLLPNKFKKFYIESLYAYFLSDWEDSSDQGKIAFIEQAAKDMEEKIINEYAPTYQELGVPMFSYSDNYSTRDRSNYYR